MPQFAANLTMLFTELPFMDRFAQHGQPVLKRWNTCSPTPMPKKTSPLR
jgi:hydroxypyruvate isomerase